MTLKYSIAVGAILLLINGYYNCAQTKILHKWPWTCRGKQQSPINIKTNQIEKNNDLLLSFSPSYFNHTQGVIWNNGYTVEINVTGSKPYVTSVFGNEKYFLQKAFFSWPSQHQINGKRLRAGLYYVHYAEKYGSYKTALKRKDGLLVVGTEFKYSRKNNPCFEPIVRAVRSIGKHPFYFEDFEGIPGSCFPENRSFYRYRGSLPIPSCTKSVTWILFAKPSTISRNQLSQLTAVYTKKGKLIKRNARKIQKLHGRKVYFKKDYNYVI